MVQYCTGMVSVNKNCGFSGAMLLGKLSFYPHNKRCIWVSIIHLYKWYNIKDKTVKIKLKIYKIDSVFYIYI